MPRRPTTTLEDTQKRTERLISLLDKRVRLTTETKARWRRNGVAHRTNLDRVGTVSSVNTMCNWVFVRWDGTKRGQGPYSDCDVELEGE